MKFGTYLQKCIDENDTTVTIISKLTGINRGKIYYAYEGKRKISQDELFAIIDAIGLTTAQAQKLIELYFEEEYGKKEFSRIKYIEKAVTLNNYTAKSIKYDFNGKDLSKTITSAKQLINTVAFMFYNDKNIITNYNSSNEELDRAVFDCYMKTKSKFTRVLEFYSDDSGYENVESLISSLKYMYNGVYPVFRYTEKESSQNCIFSHYFAGEKYALLFNGEYAIFFDDKSAVDIIRNKAQTLANESEQFCIKTTDIMLVKEIYSTGAKNNNRISTSFSYYPCLGMCADYEFMESITKDELPQKKMLVDIAYEYYNTLYNKKKVKLVSTVGGIEKFADEGNVQEISSEYVNPASKKQRIRMLKKLIEYIENDKYYILDNEKLNMLPGIEFATQPNRFVCNGYNINVKDFNSNDKFMMYLSDKSILNTFNNFADYVIMSKMVYPKEYSIRFINELILKLNHSND